MRARRVGRRGREAGGPGAGAHERIAIAVVAACARHGAALRGVWYLVIDI